VSAPVPAQVEARFALVTRHPDGQAVYCTAVAVTADWSRWWWWMLLSASQQSRDAAAVAAFVNVGVGTSEAAVRQCETAVCFLLRPGPLWISPPLNTLVLQHNHHVCH